MRDRKIEKALGNLLDTKIGLILSDDQFMEGFLLDIKQDHIVIEVDRKVYYIAHQHIQAISKDAKDFGSSSEKVSYLDRQYLIEVVKAMQSNWVIFNDSSSQSFNGFISKIIEDYILLINNDELFYVPKSYVLNVYGTISEEEINLKNQELVERQKSSVLNNKQDEVENEHPNTIQQLDNQDLVSHLELESEKQSDSFLVEELKDTLCVESTEEVNLVDIELSPEPELLEIVDRTAKDDAVISKSSHSEEASEASIINMEYELEKTSPSTLEEVAGEQNKESTAEIVDLNSSDPGVKLPTKLELMRSLYFIIDNEIVNSKPTKRSKKKLDYRSEEKPVTSLDEEREAKSEGNVERVLDDQQKFQETVDLKGIDGLNESEANYSQSLKNKKKDFEDFIIHLEHESEAHSLDEELAKVPHKERAEEACEISGIEDVNVEITLESVESVEFSLDDEIVHSDLIPSDEKVHQDFGIHLEHESEEQSTSLLDEEIEEVQYETMKYDQLEQHQQVEFKKDLNLLEQNIESLLNLHEEHSSKVGDQVRKDLNSCKKVAFQVGDHTKRQNYATRRSINDEQLVVTRLDNPIDEEAIQLHDEKPNTMEEFSEAMEPITSIRQLSPHEEKEILQKQYSSLMKHVADYLLEMEGHFDSTDSVNKEARNHNGCHYNKTGSFHMSLSKKAPVEKNSAIERQYMSLMNHAAKMYWQLRD